MPNGKVLPPLTPPMPQMPLVTPTPVLPVPMLVAFGSVRQPTAFGYNGKMVAPVVPAGQTKMFKYPADEGARRAVAAAEAQRSMAEIERKRAHVAAAGQAAFDAAIAGGATKAESVALGTSAAAQEAARIREITTAQLAGLEQVAQAWRPPTEAPPPPTEIERRRAELVAAERRKREQAAAEAAAAAAAAREREQAEAAAVAEAEAARERERQRAQAAAAAEQDRPNLLRQVRAGNMIPLGRRLVALRDNNQIQEARNLIDWLIMEGDTNVGNRVVGLAESLGIPMGTYTRSHQ